MAKDDRFTVIVVVLVTLITAGAFLWSHWGSLAISTRPNATDVAASSAEGQTVPDATPALTENSAPKGVVPAVFEIEAAAEEVVQAGNPAVSPGDRTPATLEKLVHGWTAPDLPAASEILVRRDRDGRMVVASGTRRRYESLRQDIQDLNPSDIDSTLLRLAGSSSTDAEFFRAALIETIDSVLAIEIPDVEPDMVAGVNAWQFADTEYRSLSPAQQHLLLMGRDNARAVRAKMVEIRQHLGEPDGIEPDQPSNRNEPVVIAHSLPSDAPIDELIEP
ncbi:MAG: DUF3014 domain-containing protein [Acidobacteriota bacterium]